MRLSMAFILLAFSSFTYSEPPSLLMDGGVNALLSTKNSFAITVDDEVTGGCLSSPNSLKNKLEVGIRRNHFNIQDTPSFFNTTISVSALGYRLQSTESCVVVISAELTFPVSVTVPYSGNLEESNTITIYMYPFYTEILTGPRIDMQDRLEASSTKIADALFLEISRAQDNIFSKFPALKKEYEKTLD